ncbi:glycoside hydrolase family 35 protein [Fistulina hepatica ATCC 64428]|nr:glycoside hydrolase family 35 protein [Fistulina hepatica ATCC 64428]
MKSRPEESARPGKGLVESRKAGDHTITRGSYRFGHATPTRFHWTAVLFISNWTGLIRYDNYSLIIKGQRIFLNSGEFHAWRLPVPSLWPDIMQKAKAAGLNAISTYVHQGMHNPSRGVYDFGGLNSLELFFEAAMAAGLWVVYINAETTAGGIAHWITSEVAGDLRTNASDWRDAWTGYLDAVLNVTVPYQVSRGGPVIAMQIDNEFDQDDPSHAWYYEDIKRAYHSSDIDVPLTYNDPGPLSNFINGSGAADLYGLDSYPVRFDCSNPHLWPGNVSVGLHRYHQRVNHWQPLYIPEFQGGSFDAWGPGAPGYAKCWELTNPEFQSVFNLHLWASNAKLINYYMFYGGTSWGGLPFPGVYTSYDYGAPLTESRQLTAKYDELKRQSMFLRSSPEFYKTDWVSDSLDELDIASDLAIYSTLLRNPDTDARFYVVRQNDSTSTEPIAFSLQVSVGADELIVPQVASSIILDGRQSKMIVTNYHFGASSTLAYSTAPIFFAGTIDGRDVLFLYGDSTQEHEFALHLVGRPNPVLQAPTSVRKASSSLLGTIVTVLAGLHGLTTIWDSDRQLVLFADTTTAGTFWSPTIAGSNATDPFREFWQYGTNDAILVGGPYLVRNASISGSTLALCGDLEESAMLTVIGPKKITHITWNDQDVSLLPISGSVSSIGGFVGLLETVTSTVVVPVLENWVYHDSLPEILDSFHDSEWVTADHLTTNIPYKPYYGDGRVLYGCDYGFGENVVIWRGHFDATGAEKSVNLSINGGEAFAASVWLNDVFLGTSYGNSTNNLNVLEETDDEFVLPAHALRLGGDNVITVVQDNMGLNQTDGAAVNSPKSPRGIRGFQLNDGSFGEWKVQGKIGGYVKFVRGTFNEGGLYGEREGWHLPGFNTSSWISRPLSSGLLGDAAGVGFFVNTFDLDTPYGVDIPMSVVFREPLGQPYRALLYVNGWMMGKRVGNLGPQSRFPVPEGILDYHGKNTVAIALWTMESNSSVAPDLALEIEGQYEGGVGGIVYNNPGWTSDGRAAT